VIHWQQSEVLQCTGLAGVATRLHKLCRCNFNSAAVWQGRAKTVQLVATCSMRAEVGNGPLLSDLWETDALVYPLE
jgi:hypothetical protein